MRRLMPYPPQPLPRTPRFANLKRQAIISATILVAAWLIITNSPLRDLLDSGWGWVALVAAVVLYHLLHHFPLRQWARVLVTGGVGVLLAVALVTAASAPAAPPAKHRKPPTQTEATVNVEELRGAALDLWQRLASGFSKYTTPPAQAKEGR